MICTLCEKQIEDIEAAIEEGWIPEFYVGEQRYEIACSACFDNYLQFDEEDGEVELRPEYVNTFMASSSAHRESFAEINK